MNMARIVVALVIVFSLLGLTVQASSAKTMHHAPVIRAGGLGDTRAGFEKLYGKPKADTWGPTDWPFHADSADFFDKKLNAHILVSFLVNNDNKLRSTDRAFDMEVDIPSGGDTTWTIDQANALALSLLPTDAKPTSNLAPAATTPPQTTIFWEEQFYASTSLAKAIPNPLWWTTDGTVGHLGVSLMADSYGSWNTIAVGTDVQ